MDAGLGALIGTIGGAILSGAGGLAANYQNSQMDKENREWNEKMWNLSNEYNLPENQLARFTNAGLNANLIYGGGTSSLSSYAGNLSSSRSARNPLENAKIDNAFVVGKQLENETLVAESTAERNNAEAYKATAEGRSAYVKANVDEASEEEYIWAVNQACYLLRENTSLTESQAMYFEELYKDVWYKNQVSADVYNVDFENPIEVLIGSTDHKKYFVKCYDGLAVQSASALAECVKKGLDVDVAMNTYNKISTEIRINKATEQNIITDTKLKEVEQSYYKSLEALNYAQRQKVFSDMAVNNAIIKNLTSVSNLNYAQAEKFTKEASELLRNGQTQRFKTLVQERFGSGAANQIINLFYNSVVEKGNLHVDPRDMTPYYQKK